MIELRKELNILYNRFLLQDEYKRFSIYCNANIDSKEYNEIKKDNKNLVDLLKDLNELKSEPTILDVLHILNGIKQNSSYKRFLNSPIYKSYRTVIREYTQKDDLNIDIIKALKKEKRYVNLPLQDFFLRNEKYLKALEWHKILNYKENYKIKEYLYSFDGELNEKIYQYSFGRRPDCICGGELKFISFNMGYQKFCSKKCMILNTNKNREHIQNIDDLNINYIKRNFLKNGVFDIHNAIEYYNLGISYFYKNSDKYELQNARFHKIKNKTEQDIYAILNEDKNMIHSNRKLIKPFELDMYSEEYKFAIEYNGILWHSSGTSFPNKVTDKNYHLMKTDMCESKNTQLFHIFENEWLDTTKRGIWISMLRGKQQKHSKLGARKCTIEEVTSNDANTFLLENHLQGPVSSSIRIALIYDGSIVSLMTFGKSRMSKKYEYELYRFCTKKNLVVQGAGSRLLSYFEKNHSPKSLISYANRRWSQGNLYEQLGFTFTHNSSPNMFWFKGGSMKLESRQKFQKHKLKDIDGFVFDTTKTAKENMFDNDYRVIYDSGNKIYKKEYSYDKD